MATHRRRGSKAVFKPFESNSTGIRLTNSLVHDIDAVPPAMATGNTLGLPVEGEIQSTQVSKLTHWVLNRSECRASARTHRNSTLDATMSGHAVRCESWGLERQNLIGGKLLLIERLLLLL